MKIRIVGAGIAGLTAAAFLAKQNRKDWEIDVYEYSDTPGGLVKGRWKDGFYLDEGIRAFENAGILKPMLQSLGMELPFLTNPISLGIEKEFVPYHGMQSLSDYLALLVRLFPSERNAIETIETDIRYITERVHQLYSIENPLFQEKSHDFRYIGQFLSWLLRYPQISHAMKQRKAPIQTYLTTFTKNQSLIDLLAQHFFAGTPAFFALSYFGVYGEYLYPTNGTKALTDKMVSYLQAHGVTIRYKHKVLSIDPKARSCRIAISGKQFSCPYDVLIWAGNTTPLEVAEVIDKKSRKYPPTESVLTLQVGLKRPPHSFSPWCPGHSFWTPNREGLSSLGSFSETVRNEAQAIRWLHQYMKRTTYEISIPALRNPKLAPAGQTGLILSTILHQEVENFFQRRGNEERFRQLAMEGFYGILKELCPEYQESLVFSSLTTPRDVERYTCNTGGAISGWKIDENSKRSPSLFRAIQTKSAHIFQAGQWTYQPAGVPVSILTGKMAADAVIRNH